MNENKLVLKGQTALVTGAAVRIGAAISLALAESGAKVVIHYRRSRAAALKLQRRIMKQGGHAFVVAGALDTETGCRCVMARARACTGRLDILVNNAAMFHKDTFLSLSNRSLRREFQTNLFGPLLLIREFARMEQGGVIVNMLDRRIAGLDFSCVPYLLSKKALAEATRSAALALAPHIRVNGVAPGSVLPPPGRGRSYLSDKAGPVPLKQSIRPKDVAAAVVFLAASPNITGQILFVDGGQALLGESCFDKGEV